MAILIDRIEFSFCVSVVIFVSPVFIVSVSSSCMCVCFVLCFHAVFCMCVFSVCLLCSLPLQRSVCLHPVFLVFSVSAVDSYFLCLVGSVHVHVSGSFLVFS